ncbi:hypothetical protein KUL72_31750 [Bradyrhizobium arachidis]|uniref:hypothetical protein n=1 Tax=Bradyrhizobium arachidis TaxID=858423 RepID=UPI0021613153|nr:hypothetical protein [Bradyrhizobium arachidis]UVO35845.1 hypothetical protein KUL72_31750 [Bradyrhizobium arachidis]
MVTPLKTRTGLQISERANLQRGCTASGRRDSARFQLDELAVRASDEPEPLITSFPVLLRPMIYFVARLFRYMRRRNGRDVSGTTIVTLSVHRTGCNHLDISTAKWA